MRACVHMHTFTTAHVRACVKVSGVCVYLYHMYTYTHVCL